MGGGNGRVFGLRALRVRLGREANYRCGTAPAFHRLPPLWVEFGLRLRPARISTPHSTIQLSSALSGETGRTSRAAGGLEATEEAGRLQLPEAAWGFCIVKEWPDAGTAVADDVVADVHEAVVGWAAKGHLQVETAGGEVRLGGRAGRFVTRR